MQQAAKAAKEGLSGLGSLLDSVATKLTVRQQDGSGQQGGATQPQQVHHHPLQASPLAALVAVASGGSRAGSTAADATAQPQQQQQQQQQYPAPARPTVPIEARISRFKQELLASRINLPELRRLAYQGIPDRDGLRALTWKLLLGYLPPDPSEWDEVLARKRTEYFLFCEDLIVDPKKAELEQQQQQQTAGSTPPADGASCSGSSGGGGDSGAAGSSSKHTAASGSITSSSAAAGPSLDPLSGGSGGSSSGGGSTRHDPLSQPSQELKGELPGDHPLSLNSTSKWHTFFKDNEIMEQIERDVLRTHPDMHFFSGDTPDAEQHRREMQRCLFMYAKLNPGLRYIQGMNELLAPLYHAFACDVDATAARYAEADAFYCFVDLISEFRDHFCQQLDNSSSGIKATIGKLVALLQAHDPQLAAHLQKHKVDPQFFAFRWITLLLTQEFPFPDAVRIWDTLLSDAGGRPDCLMRVCVAMLCHVRQTLLEGDFAVIVKTLQRFPSVDVDVILRAAARLPPCESVLGAPL